MKQKTGFAASKIAALTLALGALSPMLLPMPAARAQDEVAVPAANAPTANAPAANAPATRTRRPRATPAEREAARAAREAARAERMERTLRAALTRAGTVDAATQDAVIAYSRNEMAARQAASQATGKLTQALRARAVTDSQLSIVLNGLRDDAAAERTRRQRAASALDAQIGYTKKPRLEAVLVLSGLIGDEAMTLNSDLPTMPRVGAGRRAAGAAGNATRRPRRNATTNANTPAAPNAAPANGAMPAP